MKKSDQRGQILIIILLVLVVSIALVLSLVSRSVTDVRTSATTEQSNRAYFAAEAGVEQALKQLKDNPYYDTSVSGPITGNFPTNQSNFTTQVTLSGGTTPFAFPNPFTADNPAQVNLLKNYQCLNSASVVSSCSSSGSYLQDSDRIYVYWGNDNNTDPNTNTAAEITFIYEKEGTYGVAKVAYDSNSSRGNSFRSRVDGCVPLGGCFNTNCDSLNTQLGTKNYKHCQEINFTDLDLGIPAGATLYLVRIRLLYNTQAEPIAIAPKNNTSLPAQGSEIVSTGSIPGGANRKLRVFRSFPALPGIFDYVLFNGSSTPLSK